MNGGKNRYHGYTIVEVMIFLAISGMMFLLAAAFIQGKQASVAFSDAVGQLDSQLHDVISSVGDGEFPDSGTTFDCQSTNPGSDVAWLNFTTSATLQQGEHSNCEFLGKMLQFDPVDSSNNVQPNAYNIFTIAGRRLDATGLQLATQLVDTTPTAVDQTSPIVLDLTEANTIPDNVSATLYVDGSPAAGFGFFGSLGATGASGLNSGAQVVQLLKYITQPSPNNTKDNAALAVRNRLDGTTNLTAATGSVVICLSDGSRKASITVGMNDGQLTTDPELGEGISSLC